eukprot:2960534-Rhodomonas_salina.1
MLGLCHSLQVLSSFPPSLSLGVARSQPRTLGSLSRTFLTPHVSERISRTRSLPHHVNKPTSSGSC